MLSNPSEPWVILLVDDDQEDYLITRALLQQSQGRKVTLDWAPTYALAEQLLSANHYHAVLVDYDLGAKTGIDLIRETSARGCSAPLILFTGRGSYEVDMEAMQAGAMLYLTKSEVSAHLLERFIRYAIERKRIEDELDRRLQERSDILESIQDGFFSIDRGWRITFTNLRATEKIGLTPRDLLGKVIWDVLPQLRGTPVESRYRRTMEERTPEQFEFKGVITSSWYNITTYPSVEGISVFWQDISQRKAADDVMKRSQATYRALARNFPNGAIFVFDREMHALVAGGEALEQIGLSRELILGDAGEEALEEPLRSAVIGYIRRALAGESLAVEAELKGRSLLTQFAPLRDDAGEVIGSIVLIQDFTRQKQAEQALEASETSYRMLFNTMLTGFALHEILCDPSGKPVDYRFLEVNPAFERLTGLTSAEILGRTVREVLPGIEPLWIDIYGGVALTGEPTQFEQTAGPLQRTYEVYAFSPRANQFATLFTDITRRKLVEAELKDFAAKLQRSNQALEEFAMIASHDMREPLRKVQAFGEILRAKYAPALGEQGLDYLERMQQAAGRMGSMLDGLLEYSRVGTRNRPFGQVDLDRIARDVLADLEVRMAQVGGQVELLDLPSIEADPLQMRQLFQNLVGNALKFHRPGVPPRVKVSAEVAPGGIVQLVVEDNGIGFAPDEAGKLFQPFHRLVGKFTFDGDGMGLAICRKIIERHGGSIRAEGRPGQGATFIINLPLKQ